MGEVPGIDVERTSRWIAEHTTLEPPFAWSRLPGGHSNLTYRISDARGQEAVVRRPPLGPLLPKAHDMGREYRVLRALHPAGVPVPEPFALCEEPGVTGAPFYVMEFVVGRALYSRRDTLETVPEERRHRVGESFIDVLAHLHSLDPDEVGLGDLGRRDGYVARQLHRWYSSWTASREAAAIDLPKVDELYEQLVARVPEQGPARVVHGDYGLHNCMIGPDHTVAAVLDWEICTLGDPLADLAYSLNSWVESDDAIALRGDAATQAPGFPRRSELLTRYAERTGRDLGGIDFYVAFNYWKSTCIVQGVYARYVKGQKSTEGIDVDALAARVHASAQLAEQAFARLEEP